MTRVYDLEKALSEVNQIADNLEVYKNCIYIYYIRTYMIMSTNITLYIPHEHITIDVIHWLCSLIIRLSTISNT